MAVNLYSAAICHGLLPLVSVATRSACWPLSKKIQRRHQRPSLQPTSADRLERLRALVAHAHASVPFYRDRLDALNLKPESFVSPAAFRQLPPTTKADIAA